jgi:chitinase
LLSFDDLPCGADQPLQAVQPDRRFRSSAHPSQACVPSYRTARADLKNGKLNMKRRLFLTGSAGAALGLVGCGGGGGGTTAAVADTTSQIQSGTQTPTQAATPSTLGSKILACYFTGWDASYALTAVPMDFNVIYLFNAQNGGTNTGDGSWTWPFADNVTAAQIQEVRRRGQKVVLTVGGAGLGFSYNDRTQSTNCVNSIRSIIASMGGIDGIDFNNYEAGIGTSATEMIWIAQQLIATYGSDFIITTPPQPNAEADLALCQAMANAGALTYAAPQFYDWSGFNEPGFISGRIQQWTNGLGASKVMIGLSANYSNGPSLSDCTREWNAAVAANPELRGSFCWSAQTNIAGGNVWGSNMRSLL